MGDIISTQDIVKEGVDLGYTLGRVPGRNGNALVILDVRAVSLEVKDISLDQPQIIYTNSMISPATVMYDTLQTDARWSIPDGGFNFAHYLDFATAYGAVDQVGGHTYQLKYTLSTTLANGSGDILIVRHASIAPVI